MPQHANARSFIPGDPRASAAGRKGGKSRAFSAHSTDYTLGYRAGARSARRHLHRWIQESTMQRLGHTPFMRIALTLNAAQVNAPDANARQSADADLAHFLRMASLGRLDEWITSHPEYANGLPLEEDIDDSMSANPDEF